MDRRQFFLKTGLLSAALGARVTPGLGAVEKQNVARPVTQHGKLDLTNPFLTWHLEWHDKKIASTGFENKISGREFTFRRAKEIILNFSSLLRRIEIPGWRFTFGPDKKLVSAESERGIQQGYHRLEYSDLKWGVTENLLLRGLSGVERGHDAIRFDGYGWFRHRFELPSDAQGKALVFVLGGYDCQDWNEYWIYVNGHEIGYRTAGGRWRTPGQFSLDPGSSAYSSLRFGSGEKNLLAVRTRGYDKRFGGLNDEVLRHYVYEPVWADQFISVGPPFLQVDDFEVQRLSQHGPAKVALELRSRSQAVSVTANYELDGPTRRKWFEIENQGEKDLLLLDIHLDEFSIEAATSEGGAGEPVFIADEVFSALEHPAGLNQGDQGSVRLIHFPGRLLPPGGKLRSHVALVSVGEKGRVLDHFISYIQEKSPRRKKAISLYTPYGINNQWGGCPPLDDEETLNVLGVLEKWQQKGLRFDYFTLDQGWMDNAGDLTRFAPQCFPVGAGKIAERVKALGMNFGLWFSVSGAGWSCGENPAVKPSFIPPPGDLEETRPSDVAYRNGYIANGGIPGQLCVASEPYFNILRDAVLHHIRENSLKFFKLDIGSYYCNSTSHQHLPGKYSVEAMYERLLDIAASARQADPDVYVMWYWGVRSPFFALYGDSIFESGLFMEGSGTSWFPTLYYRDSVTLNLDQSTQFARTIPPINKDSLGVWLADIRWGNFMGNERWREAMIMDLGRGNLLFPQIWGDPYLLDDGDIAFLSDIQALVKKNEAVFLRRRNILGDPWRNEVYGYSNIQGARGFLFINNAHFAARKAELHLDAAVGIEAAAGIPLEIISHFPAKERLAREEGSSFRTGEVAEVWLRPFETLMVEVRPSSEVSEHLPTRRLSSSRAADMGVALALKPLAEADWMKMRFADEARFERQGFKKKFQAWTTTLPNFEAGPHILAVTVKLQKEGIEWRYSPAVVEIAQVICRVGTEKLTLHPVPDARQYGNTQKMGGSWIVYKARLNPAWSGLPAHFAFHAYLPESVDASIEAWVVEQWWKESARPLGDGYYGDAPS
jgi:hypothetical protein